MSILVPDWRQRLKISIIGGCVQFTNLEYDSHGNPFQPTIPNMQVITGIFANPNGNLMPANPTIANIYYLDDPVIVNVWLWSVIRQNWFQILA